MNKVCVVMYHGIDTTGSVISTTPELFARHIETWKSQGLRFLSHDEFFAFMQGGKIDHDAILLTFDDALLSVYTDAFPILRKESIPAMVFLVSGFMAKTNRWPGQPDSIPELPIMSWDQAREINAAGIHLGVHTATHPRLAGLDKTLAAREFDDCIAAMKRELGTTPRSMAYPYGAVSRAVKFMANQRFTLGFGTRVGRAEPLSDLMDIPRIDAYDLRGEQVYTRLFTPAGDAYLSLRGAVRAARNRLRVT